MYRFAAKLQLTPKSVHCTGGIRMYVLRTYAYYYSLGTRLVLDLLLNCLQ